MMITTSSKSPPNVVALESDIRDDDVPCTPPADAVEPAPTPTRERAESLPREAAARRGTPWWRNGWFVTMLGALASFAVPATTAVSGLIATKQKQLEIESKIVSEHLGNALSTRVGTDEHIRLIRFLKDLTHDDALPWISPNLLGQLGRWARQEYGYVFMLNTIRAHTLDSRINANQRELDELERENEADKRAKRLEEQAWREYDDTKLAANRSEAIKQVDQILRDRDPRIEKLKAELAKDRKARSDLMLVVRSTRDDPLAGVHESSVRYLESRCGVDEPSACHDLGQLLVERNGDPEAMERNAKRAFDTVKRTCEVLKFAPACTTLGRWYRKGLGTRKDDARAVEAYRRSCDADNPSGCNGLGWRYKKGEGVEQDSEMAQELFHRACLQGHMNGCDSLGSLLYENAKRATTRSTKKELKTDALGWYEYACALEEARACLNRFNLIAGRPPTDYSRM